MSFESVKKFRVAVSQMNGGSCFDERIITFSPHFSEFLQRCSVWAASKEACRPLISDSVELASFTLRSTALCLNNAGDSGERRLTCVGIEVFLVQDPNIDRSGIAAVGLEISLPGSTCRLSRSLGRTSEAGSAGISGTSASASGYWRSA